MAPQGTEQVLYCWSNLKLLGTRCLGTGCVKTQRAWKIHVCCRGMCLVGSPSRSRKEWAQVPAEPQEHPAPCAALGRGPACPLLPSWLDTGIPVREQGLDGLAMAFRVVWAALSLCRDLQPDARRCGPLRSSLKSP